MKKRQKLFCSLALLTSLWSGGLMANPALMAAWEAMRSGDYQAAYQIWLPLAEQGSSRAQNNLGLMYLQGQGVRQDNKKALYWLDKAASLGSAPAQTTLAILHLQGRGVAQNRNLAFELFYAAAQAGHPPAQFNLGRMYSEGIAVSRNYKKALQWFHRAANRGHAGAQSVAADLLQRGLGVQPSSAPKRTPQANVG